jgi:5-methyltetrahydrofolate--homocysteine methyltransferase
LLERVRAGERLVGDGAFGTLLMESGLRPGEAPEVMVFRDPAAVRRVTAAYLEAGADVVHTNTFGASPLKLADSGLGGRCEEIVRTALELARDAVGDRALVSLSMGPTGRLLEPYGDTSEAAVLESFRRQVEAALAPAPDLVTVETMTDPREAVLAIRAVRDALPDLPLLATMTFDATPRGFHTVMGTDIEAAAAALLGAGADVVGSNCGNGVEGMVEVARRFREVTDAPLVIQANAGTPELRAGAVRYPETPEDFARAVPAFLAAGVSVIGGCCGTTPAHVRALAEMIRKG